MNKVLSGIAISTVAVVALVNPVSAIGTASGNIGSIVKVSDSCANLGEVASNNIGSIVKIDGGGTCDINEVMKSPALKNNIGSIIKISNVCGNTDGIANNNIGSIIKVDSNGPCKKDAPTTVVVTPKDSEQPASVVKQNETPAEAPKQTTSTPSTASAQMPAELPSTGPGELLASIIGLASLAGASYYFRASRRKLADTFAQL